MTSSTRHSAGDGRLPRGPSARPRRAAPAVLPVDPRPDPQADPPGEMCERWRELCGRYLPRAAGGSGWRYSRAPAQGDPPQGWKLHLSATVLTAAEVLERVAPFLTGRGASFKAPSTLKELGKLNSGLFYGYSQIGKFITVYPRSDEEAVIIAERLDGLTRGLTAPRVPFDRRLRPGSCVYYRYGAFEPLEIENADGTRTPAVRDPAGRLVPDLRDSEAQPAWASDPFERSGGPPAPARAETPLSTTYRVYAALAQRGRGGVYEAIDLSASGPRLCVVKEGRAGGEVAWDGRDGFWRVRHEAEVVNALRSAGVRAPCVYASFEAEGNYYLVTELVEGETLKDLLRRRRRRLAVGPALSYGARLASLLSDIHAAGWAWRDCKPANVIVTKKGELRPLDFEGACRADLPDPSPWGTPGFSPPAPPAAAAPASRVDDDLYALGATIYFLLTARLPETPADAPFGRLRRGLPAEARRAVTALLDPDPRARPSARAVAEHFDAIVSGSARRLAAVRRRPGRGGRDHAARVN